MLLKPGPMAVVGEEGVSSKDWGLEGQVVEPGSVSDASTPRVGEE